MKKIIRKIKFQILGNSANPAPPIGPTLGSVGINIMLFCKKFNERTKNKKNILIPTVVTVYNDKSFSFILKSSPTTFLLKKFSNITKGSKFPNKKIVGNIYKKDIKKIAKMKIKDLNTNNINKAIKIIEGSAKSMGINILS